MKTSWMADGGDGQAFAFWLVQLTVEMLEEVIRRNSEDFAKEGLDVVEIREH